jgi:hypothetical protein
VVVSDEVVARERVSATLWGTDAPPAVRDATLPVMAGWWPPPGGLRVTLCTTRPAGLPQDTPGAWPDINAPSDFHESPSVDLVVMISGRVWLELDNGEVELTAGDVLVQNGTRHRWRNHASEWPLMAVIIVGARPIS